MIIGARLFLTAFSACLTGCVASGDSGARWMGAKMESVLVNGSNYQVFWLPVGSGQFDFQSRRIALLPDPIIERQNMFLASEIVAKRLCGTEKITVVLNDFDANTQQNVSRIKCS